VEVVVAIPRPPWRRFGLVLIVLVVSFLFIILPFLVIFGASWPVLKMLLLPVAAVILLILAFMGGYAVWQRQLFALNRVAKQLVKQITIEDSQVVLPQPVEVELGRLVVMWAYLTEGIARSLVEFETTERLGETDRIPLNKLPRGFTFLHKRLWRDNRYFIDLPAARFRWSGLSYVVALLDPDAIAFDRDSIRLIAQSEEGYVEAVVNLGPQVWEGTITQLGMRAKEVRLRLEGKAPLDIEERAIVLKTRRPRKTLLGVVNVQLDIARIREQQGRFAYRFPFEKALLLTATEVRGYAHLLALRILYALKLQRYTRLIGGFYRGEYRLTLTANLGWGRKIEASVEIPVRRIEASS